MSRYIKENSGIRYDGKPFLLSHSYPKPKAKDSDILYITKEDDRLDSLAYKFYKNETLWWILSIYNNIGLGRMSLEEGTQIRIPVDIDVFLNNHKNINN